MQVSDSHIPAKTAMKVKLKKFNTVKKEFKINKEKRTIACILTTHEDFLTRVNKYGLYLGWEDEYHPFDNRIYKGIAKCSPNDEWNETYGKHLAEYRAERMRQVDINNQIKNYINKTAKKLDNLYDYGMLKEPHKPKENER